MAEEGGPEFPQPRRLKASWPTPNNALQDTNRNDTITETGSQSGNALNTADPKQDSFGDKMDSVAGASVYLSKPVQGGALNIGAGTRPQAGAYNIDIDPRVEGVYYVNVTDLSNVPTGSQSKIIMQNPYKYKPLGPEISRVLQSGGTIEITGGMSNRWFNIYYKMTSEQLAALGYEIVSKGPSPDPEKGCCSSGDDIMGTPLLIVLRKK